VRRGTLVERVVGVVNARVAVLADSPRWGRLVGRHIVIITYVGRRSGRTFSTPVGYRRASDEITIGVRFPDAKTWWRNFLGVGGPLALHLDGTDRSGHAVARRDDRGSVIVTVYLDSP
jgi:hypothetical protein